MPKGFARYKGPFFNIFEKSMIMLYILKEGVKKKEGRKRTQGVLLHCPSKLGKNSMIPIKLRQNYPKKIKISDKRWINNQIFK